MEHADHVNLLRRGIPPAGDIGQTSAPVPMRSPWRWLCPDAAPGYPSQPLFA
jgi:hypothetical protein